jgi:hypothetical protein
MKGFGMGNFLQDLETTGRTEAAVDAGGRLAALLDRSRNCGDLIGLEYGFATVLVHDYLRASVGGVSKGCFLLASRVVPGTKPDASQEDTSLILLRVLDKAPLPNSSDTDRMRFEAGTRVSAAPEGENWDDERALDKYTANFLRFAGVRCRVLGTFMMRSKDGHDWNMVFGADVANIYSGRGMKVYKPDGDALDTIANYVRARGSDAHALAGERIRVGRVRYAASERQGDTTGLTGVTLDPTDLIARRTALFGMSRTGKSNTVKIIASSVFGLRDRDSVRGRVGQLILDANGEYANENAIDKGALRNVWTSYRNASKDDVVTYGLHPHPRDPDRKLVKLNFFGKEPRDWNNRDQVEDAMAPLVQAKQVVDAALAQENAKYITAFRNVTFDLPEIWDHSAATRYRRAVTAYRSVLARAGFTPPGFLRVAKVKGLTNAELRTAIAAGYQRVAAIFAKEDASWDEAAESFEGLHAAIKDKSSGYADFNAAYQDGHDGRDWHDPTLLGILAILDHWGGVRVVGKARVQHSPNSTDDYADQIVADLAAGKLVIVDQSTGDPEMNEAAAKRLMWAIFNGQKSRFTDAKIDQASGELILPPDVIVYVEEAHNLLPKDGADLKEVWPRVAKEGSKYRIGLVYATQEPSSILTNILSNTDNWFVAHLNRGAEVKQVRDFYDFGDFEEQILNVPEPGFIRMRTLSNPYVVPVQIDPYIAAKGQTNQEAGR